MTSAEGSFYERLMTTPVRTFIKRLDQGPLVVSKTLGGKLSTSKHVGTFTSGTFGELDILARAATWAVHSQNTVGTPLCLDKSQHVYVLVHDGALVSPGELYLPTLELRSELSAEDQLLLPTFFQPNPNFLDLRTLQNGSFGAWDALLRLGLAPYDRSGLSAIMDDYNQRQLPYHALG